MRLTLSLVTFAIFAAAAPPRAGLRNGISIPITKRSNLLNIDKSVNVGALNAHVASVNAKVLRGFEMFERNTGESHPSAVIGAEKRGADIPLTDDHNVLWYGSVDIGTPPKRFTAVLDTGSSDFFVPRSDCGPTCKNHTLWNPLSSSTAKTLNKTFAVRFGDGSTVRGDQYSDSVVIAGFEARDQTLGAAKQYSTGFQFPGYPADGLMGLGFKEISGFDANGVFETLVSQGTLDDASFSFKLTATGSELFVGGSNGDLYKGDFIYTPVTRRGYWEVKMDDIQSNGQTIQSNIDAIIDTGTTLIIIPTAHASKLYEAIGGTPAPPSFGEGFYTFDCDSFPTISLSFGGTSFTIPPEALNIGHISQSSSQCVSGISGASISASFWVVGDVFLQSVYTKFDYGNSQVGFAQLA